MTQLVELIWKCRAIKGADKLILMGWAAQLEEGNDTVYCSKSTVAQFVGLDERTILRRTQGLVKAELMRATGETKKWQPDCWTPVYCINVQKLLELTEGVTNCHGVTNRGGCQDVIQGSGSRSLSLSHSLSGATSTAGATDLRSAMANTPPKSGEITQNLKTQNPKPKIKTCPKCGEPRSRDKNHVCEGMEDFMDRDLEARMDKARQEEELGVDDAPYESLFTDGWKPMATFVGAKQGGLTEAASQKSVESRVAQGKSTLTATTLLQPAVPPSPHCKNCEAEMVPDDDFPDDALSCPSCKWSMARVNVF